MAASKSHKLVFNFSSLSAPNNDIYKKAATPKRKRSEVARTPVVVVDEDRSPLFEPLSGQNHVQIEIISAPASPYETRAKMNHPSHNTYATQDIAHTPMSGRNPQAKVNTNQMTPRTRPKSNTLVYRDGGGVTREIWQPGDPDGVRDDEFPGKPLFRKRYRFFQSEIGHIERGTNSPPHFVALDDKAVWDVLSCKKYTAKERGQFWPLDFMANGVVRANRRHKGRAAVVDQKTGDRIDKGDGQGAGKVAWTKAGGKSNSVDYYLSGEQGGYKEVVFDTPVARIGTASHTPNHITDRNDGSKTETATPGYSAERNNGGKTEYATKRKADQPLHPRHDRPKVGKYLHSTPSPTWPGGVRRLNKAPVASARFTSRDEDGALSGSAWSPPAVNGGKTVYARYDGEEPERVNGRLVAPGTRTPYARTPIAAGAKTPFVNESMGARTPFQVSSSEAKNPRPQIPLSATTPYHGARNAPSSQPPLWQHVKRMGEELEQAKGILRMRDAEISRLKAQNNISDAEKSRTQQARDALAIKDGEIQRLKEEILVLKQSLGED